MCILDSGTSHTILKDKLYFQIFPSHRPVTTITGVNQLEEGYGPARFLLPNNTLITINFAMYAPQATRNLLSFHDIRQNGFQIRSTPGHEENSLQIFTENTEGIKILETLPSHPPGLYAALIHTYQVNSHTPTPTELWHRRLGHPGTSMYHRIIKDTTGIPPTVHPTLMKDNCLACV